MAKLWKKVNPSPHLFQHGESEKSGESPNKPNCCHTNSPLSPLSFQTRTLLLCLLGATIVGLTRFVGPLWPTELNIDESVLIACSQRALLKSSWNPQNPPIIDSQVSSETPPTPLRLPLPWVDFHPTTCGPIPIWLLMPLAKYWQNGSIDNVYQALHGLALLCWVIMVFSTIYPIASVLGRATIFPMTLIWIILSLIVFDNDHFQFGTNTLATTLLSIAFGLKILNLKDNKPNFPYYACLSGLFASLSLLSKIQTLPPVACLCLLWLAFSKSGKRQNSCPQIEKTSILKEKLGFLFFLLTPIFTIFSLVAYHKGMNRAIELILASPTSYSVHGLYENQGEAYLGAKLFNMLQACLFAWDLFPIPLIATLVSITIIFLWSKFYDNDPLKLKTDPILRNLLILSALWLLGSVVAATFPNYRWPHYASYLIAPLSCLLFLIPFSITTQSQNSNTSKISVHTSIVLLLILCYPMVLKKFETPQIGAPLLARIGQNLENEVAQFITNHTTPNETILVWGWTPNLYVKSKRYPATSHVISQFLIDDNKGKENHRLDFLKDLKQNPPKLIIDTLQPPFFTWRWNPKITPRIHQIPELKNYVLENYELLNPPNPPNISNTSNTSNTHTNPNISINISKEPLRPKPQKQTQTQSQNFINKEAVLSLWDDQSEIPNIWVRKKGR